MSSVSQILPVAGRISLPATSDLGAARAAWRRRALLVGGGFQVIFGALWLARGLAAFGPPVVAIAAGASALGAGMTAVVALRRSAPRPQGSASRTIERRLTVATLLQLVASFVLPVVIGAAVGPRLAVPSIMLTIGILLAWIHREVDTPYQGKAGWALIALAAGSALLVGDVQTAVAGLTAAAILLGCAGAGYSWLRYGTDRQE
jgi:hypothetical protein